MNQINKSGETKFRETMSHVEMNESWKKIIQIHVSCEVKWIPFLKTELEN